MNLSFIRLIGRGYGVAVALLAATTAFGQANDPQTGSPQQTPVNPPGVPEQGPPSFGQPPFPMPRPTVTVNAFTNYAAPANANGERVSVVRGGMEVQWADRNPIKGRFITVTGRAETVRFIPDRESDRNRFEDMASFRIGVDTVFLRNQSRASCRYRSGHLCQRGCAVFRCDCSVGICWRIACRPTGAELFVWSARSGAVGKPAYRGSLYRG